MSSGLIALLDDIAAIARSAAASLDDIGAAAGTAGGKAAGVVIDDAAVTPRYVAGLRPERELPIIARIALGSVKNKLLILLPISLLLSALLPGAITPLLMMGGTYLAFESTEKIIELFTQEDHHGAEVDEVGTPEELEARQVAGAIRTDLILSAEIMAIALASLGREGIYKQAIVLAIVGIGITICVYGTVALVVKLDDIGLRLAETGKKGLMSLGYWLVRFVPRLIHLLSSVGTAAMLWVGGGILVHGLDKLGARHIPDLVRDLGATIGRASGPIAPVTELLASAISAALVALTVGALVTGIVRIFEQARKQRPASA